jgi:tetratricopeptide (TPR) repeat protein
MIMKNQTQRTLIAAIALAVLVLAPINSAIAQVATTAQSKEIRKLINANDYDAAVNKAEAQVQAMPNSAEAHYFLGAAYGVKASNVNMFSALGAAKKVRAAFERAAQLDPKHIEARFGLIQFHTQAPGMAGGDEDEAQRYAKELAAINPAAGFRAQAYFKMRAKDEAGALAEYRKALAADPADGDSLGAVCADLAKKKQFDQANVLIAAALAKAPTNPKLRYQVGKISALTGQNLEAGLAHLDALIALAEAPEGVSMAGAHWRRGQILDKLGRKAEAVTAVETAVRLQPKMEEAKAELKRLRG